MELLAWVGPRLNLTDWLCCLLLSYFHLFILCKHASCNVFFFLFFFSFFVCAIATCNCSCTFIAIARWRSLTVQRCQLFMRSLIDCISCTLAFSNLYILYSFYKKKEALICLIFSNLELKLCGIHCSQIFFFYVLIN